MGARIQATRHADSSLLLLQPFLLALSSWRWSLTPSWTNILWPFPPRLPGAPAWPEQTLGTCTSGLSSGKSPNRGCSGQPWRRMGRRRHPGPCTGVCPACPGGLLLLLQPPAQYLGFSSFIHKMDLITPSLEGCREMESTALAP